MGTEAPSITPPQFPLYLVRTETERKFMTIDQAGVKHASLWENVLIESLVLEADFSVRIITTAERDRITTISDRIDADK